VFRLSPVIAIVLLAGCSKPQDDARARLSGVDSGQLRMEAARLYKQLHASPGAEFAALKPAQWPPTFRKLGPTRIGCYRDGFAFVFSSAAGVETGVHVQPLGMDKMPKATMTRYERIEEGIYWFQTKP
jgi:hypothetical protein